MGAERFARTRVTAFDVVRAMEVHRYRAVIVENVVEFATRWELLQWWLDGMRLLGYRVQLVSANAAHVGDEHNPPAPQLRDRVLIAYLDSFMIQIPRFTRSGYAPPACRGLLCDVRGMRPDCRRAHRLRMARCRRPEGRGLYWSRSGRRCPVRRRLARRRVAGCC